MDNGIRRKVSKYLGEMIPEGKWEETLTIIDKRGGISQRQILDMLIIALQTIEEYEKQGNLQSSQR